MLKEILARRVQLERKAPRESLVMTELKGLMALLDLLGLKGLLVLIRQSLDLQELRGRRGLQVLREFQVTTLRFLDLQDLLALLVRAALDLRGLLALSGLRVRAAMAPRGPLVILEHLTAQV